MLRYYDSLREIKVKIDVSNEIFADVMSQLFKDDK
jgi:hypothetical protein